ncbi:gamma-butyrobetaine dioxygenase-like [Antedon mediterranea]|uniref:gamma-butyrobetaine dioxygenase-like n=1 Tax=Antedon mediterranea TaxID=105859 RepID=UPI003AF4B605
MLRVLSRTNVGLSILRKTFPITTSAIVTHRLTNRHLCIHQNQRLSTQKYLTTATYSPGGEHAASTYNIDNKSETIDILFDDKTSSRYPFVWLRDNCPCDECFDKSSLQRKILVDDFDVDDVIARDANMDSEKMTIYWTDGHTSEYPINWLHNYKFPQVTDHIQELKVSYWGSEMTKDKLAKFSFQDLMNDDDALYSWMVSLHTHGINLVTGMGTERDASLTLTERVGHPRSTCYGIDWEVKSKPEPNNLAYTGCRLCLHNDLPFYMYEPCIQLLHGIKVSDIGGESEFVDGFKVAYDLKRDDPDTFRILSTVPVGFSDQGIDEVSKSEYYLKHSKPVISLDLKGNIDKINFNQHVRGIRTGVSVDNMKSFYRAWKKFNTTLYKQENLISFKIQQGEAVCFNNIRTLHGRAEFLVPAGNAVPRHLHGNYIDWDSIYSRIRVIARNKNIFF